MARQARVCIPALPHLLSQRGHNGALVFGDDEDRKRYLHALLEGSRELQVAVHAYCLRPEQIELIATPPDEQALSRLMQTLGRRYVGAFNQRHGRSGTLWEGRFRACVVEPGESLLMAMRWVDLLPTQTGLASDLLDYPWSSAAHHLGARRDPLLSDPPVFWALGNTPFERELAYRRQLERDASPEEAAGLAQCLRSGHALGSAEFVQQLQQRTGLLLQSRPRGRPPKRAMQGTD
jgi:putative transposase